MDQAWPPHNTKRKRLIIESIRGSLRDKRNLEFRMAARCAKPCEAAGQRQDKSLDPADTRRKKMRIEQQLHGSNRGAGWGKPVHGCKAFCVSLVSITKLQHMCLFSLASISVLARQPA